MSSPDFYKEGEIDLVEYLKILIKRRNTVFAALLVVAVIIIGILIYLPNRYEAVTLVRIGRVSGSIFSPAEALFELQSQNSLAQVIKTLELKITVLKLRGMVIVEPLDNAPQIRISIKACRPGLAVKVCNALADIFVTHGNEIYNKEVALYQAHIQRLETNRFVADRERIFILKREVLLSKNFEVLLSASILPYPFVPKERQKVISLILVFGIMFAILLPVFQEFRAKDLKRV